MSIGIKNKKLRRIEIHVDSLSRLQLTDAPGDSDPAGVLHVHMDETLRTGDFADRDSAFDQHLSGSRSIERNVVRAKPDFETSLRQILQRARQSKRRADIARRRAALDSYGQKI